jgi:TPP-dependent pyruvate/acetoin dehydrogenase alpha subunit
VERARTGEGPAFLCCDTYRYHGHHVGDINREYYRPKVEEQDWKERDPLKVHAAWLVEQKHADAAQLEQIEAEVRAEIDKAVKFAIDAPYPNQEEVDRDVYA